MISRDVSLYFHIPFCCKKCPYCHFFVVPSNSDLKAQLIPALIKEWQLRLPQLEGKRVVSIYFGGGTPTQLAPSDYQGLIEAIRNSVEMSSDCEITLEANPEDVSLDLMRAFCALGINRVSLGVQSLVDDDLIMLGRTHNADKARRAIDATFQAGITNISIDLMFELPKQTMNSWQQTLKNLALLPITHLSLYNLTFEPHTVFFKHRAELIPQLPPDAERLKMLQIAVDSLESIGLQRYEISAFARPGLQSRHNTGYWTARPFFGFGPSAFSYWEGQRFSNVAHLKKYLTEIEHNQLPVDFKESLPYPHNLQELLAVQLRLVEGVSITEFTVRHGPLPECMEKSLQKLCEQGWIAKEGDGVKLTTAGQLFYDSAAVELI